jgi:hypothetical protein
MSIKIILKNLVWIYRKCIEPLNRAFTQTNCEMLCLQVTWDEINNNKDIVHLFDIHKSNVQVIDKQLS